MAYCLLAAHKIKLNINSLAVVLLLSLAGCTRCTSSGGGITIPQNDSTPPTLALGGGQPGGQNVTVSDGGSGQNMKLTSKTGALNLLVTAVDNESGVQAVEIWVNKKTTRVDASGVGSTSSPELLPKFDSTSPKKKPGESTAASRILAQTLNLSTEISQGGVPAGESRTVTFIIYAVAVNHLGGRTQTPELTATWSEP